MPTLTTGAEFSVIRHCGPYESLHYAGAGGDFNPIHIDDAFAKRAGLPGMILQGLCTLSWMVEAAVAFVGTPSSIRGVHARFNRPVLVGDDVTFAGRVIEDGETIAFSVTNQRGEVVLKDASVRVGESEAQAVDTLPGREFGPFSYVVGGEKVREFAQAIHGTAPSRIYPTYRAGLPGTYDLPDDQLVAPPTFCVNFAIQPFLAATMDPALGIDFTRVVHGEQSFAFVRPVRPGDALVTSGRLVRDFEKEGNRFVEVATGTRDSQGREVVRATWLAVVRR